MEAKLKGMKVADLKVVLQTANVTFDSKLTKQGLIKKILEAPAAVAVASTPEDGAGADDDLPDLPPSINWDDAPKATTSVPATVAQTSHTANVPQPKVPPPTPVTGATAPAQSQAAASPPTNPDGSAFKAADIPTITAEDEIDRRRARAAKWGTTFADPTTQPVTKPAAKPNAKNAAPAVVTSPPVDEKRKKREARFGASTSKASTSAVDEEEMRKRKARQERFGPSKKPRLEGEAST